RFLLTDLFFTATILPTGSRPGLKLRFQGLALKKAQLSDPPSGNCRRRTGCFMVDGRETNLE
ncbi:MAG: hypothetical protein Q8P54_02700, partial [bacterium]|nr:hypothetical protein [bacterium]